MTVEQRVTWRNGNQIGFWCPGCKQSHIIAVEGDGPVWRWNGSEERPTFSPSLLIRVGHYADPDWKPDRPCWCTWDKEHPGDPAPFNCVTCHSFVADGVIQFLSDCTHELAGQYVQIPLHEDIWYRGPKG